MARRRSRSSDARNKQIALEMIRGERPMLDTPADYFNRMRAFQPLYRSPVVLREVDDRRRYHPLGRALRPAVSIRNSALDTRMSVKRGLRKMAWHAVGFAVPDFVVTCVRRKQRKEVLHAINFGGGGGKSVRRSRRRNSLSNIFC